MRADEAPESAGGPAGSVSKVSRPVFLARPALTVFCGSLRWR
jgi:hypothetical protein